MHLSHRLVFAAVLFSSMGAAYPAAAQPSEDPPGFWGQLRATTPAGASPSTGGDQGFWHADRRRNEDDLDDGPLRRLRPRLHLAHAVEILG